MTLCKKYMIPPKTLVAGAVCLSISLISGEVALADPAGYDERLSMPVSIDGKPAVLTRFEKRKGVHNGLYAEHLSTVTTAEGALQGFVSMDLKNVIADPEMLPQPEHAKAIADKYLAEVAPDLLQDRKILWVDVHDETLRISDNADGYSEVRVQGMKVKSRNTRTGLYFWVIVGADEQVMVFERDIRWIIFPGKRGTEQWLHDAWLAKKLGTERLPAGEPERG
ncbi:MAG: hypothetical protein ACJAWL_001001 [Motiliproteus sp.]|jgi:hypothetical protein